jgi:hypothetical protein
MEAPHILDQHRDRQELVESLEGNDFERELLSTLAISSIHWWLCSEHFKTEASYYGAVVKEVFSEGRVPPGRYHRNQEHILFLWKYFGLATTRESKTGWESSDTGPSKGSLKIYRSWARSYDPVVREKGQRLLCGPSSVRYHTMVTVNFQPIVKATIESMGVSALVGKTQKTVVEQTNLPKRLVAAIFKHLKEVDGCVEKVKKINGKVSRVLVFAAH